MRDLGIRDGRAPEQASRRGEGESWRRERHGVGDTAGAEVGCDVGQGEEQVVSSLVFRRLQSHGGRLAEHLTIFDRPIDSGDLDRNDTLYS